ncbi:MAG: hydrogenase maturation protease [Actinocrinis sp.]
MPALQAIVIGVGSSELRGDAGFGAAVIETLRRQPGLADTVRLVRCDGDPGRMIELWDGYGVALVVDAVRGGCEAYGFLCRHDLPRDALLGSTGPWPGTPSGGGTGGSAHAAGLRAAVRLGHTLGRLPDRLILYAVHGRDFRPGAPLSRPVEAAVPQLAARISRDVLGVLSQYARQDERPGGHRSSDSIRVLSPSATVRA